MSTDQDDLEQLRAALKAGPSVADPVRRQAGITAAMAAFDEEKSTFLQGNADPARPKNDRPHWVARLFGGLRMIIPSTRNTLLGGASIAVLAAAVLVIQTPGLIRPVMNPPDSVYDAEFNPEETVANRRTKGLTIAPGTAPTQPQDNTVATSKPTPPAMADVEAPVAAMPSPRQDHVSQPLAEQSARLGRMLMTDDVVIQPPQGRDQFENTPLNPLRITADTPVSTFSIDVDTASYAWMRRSLEQGMRPDPASVRTEELVNYFNYDYPVPDADGVPFSTTVSVIDTPWNTGTKLMHIGIKGYELPAEERPDANLVFLIDVSGSMSQPDKLPLLINAFRLLLGELRDSDTVAIVTYAGNAGTVLEPTPVSDRNTILRALESLRSGGGTAGEAGIAAAYRLAEQVAEPGETSRVILATDGDFNIGISDPDALTRLIEEKRDSGVFLSVLGFGQGNYNDTLMQRLAQNGNGQAAYIDSLSEARKVLVENTGGALFPIAKDVKIQVEFNPAKVAEYRLIGYETRALKREDFNNDAVDAGEIGAGHTVTALYEITPVDSPARLTEPLRYPQTATATDTGEEIAFLRLRYKAPDSDTSQLIETPVRMDTVGVTGEAQFAAAVAGFGELLRGSKYLGTWSFSDTVDLARAHIGDDRFGHRAEFIRLAQLTRSIVDLDRR